MFPNLGLGPGLLISSFVVIMLVFGFTRFARRKPAQGAVFPPPFPEFTSQSNDGVVIVQPGGRVEYVNALAREWFGMNATETPDLERLTRRTRPAEDFLDLCVSEGQKRFSVNGRLTEATSYRIPGYNPLTLISLRPLSMALDVGQTDEQVQFSSSFLNVIADFSKSVSASLGLNTTLLAIFQNVGRLIPADMFEIKVQDPKLQSLNIYKYDESGPVAQAVRVSASQFGALSQTVITSQQPLFAPHGKLPGQTAQLAGLVKAYVGVPLLAEAQFVGTLEMGQISASNFTQQTLDLLQLLAGQSAVAIRNALEFEATQERAAELGGLARLSLAAGAIQDPKELFSRLVETIFPLFEIDIVGFLLYDATDHTLAAQIPFHGLPSNVVSVYRSFIQPESPAEQILLGQQAIISRDAPREASLRELGLHEIAQLASIRDAAFIPMLSGGRLVGYLQLSNHSKGSTEFSADELRLAKIIASQAATIIDNSVLVQQARQRGQRSESLRRIANLVASSATLDEILHYSMQELSKLLNTDTASIYLLHTQTNQLSLHSESASGLRPETLKSVAHLDVTESEYRLTTVSGTQRPFLSGRLSADERVSAAYRSIVEAMRIESVIIVPLIARERSVGELLLGSRNTDFFNSLDLQILSTAAGLLAAAVEGAALLNQTDETLRRRVEQLTAITHVTRELNNTADIGQLLDTIYEQSLQITHADCGSLLLFDPASDPLDPRVTVRLGCQVEEPLSALTRQVVASKKPLLITDFSNNLTPAPHADVNSAMVAPILHNEKLLGIINLHSFQPNFFEQTSLDSLQTLAIQTALAIGNTQRYQEQRAAADQLQRRTTALSHLADITTSLDHREPLEKSLRSIATSIQEATPFQVALISVYEPDTGLLRRVAGAGLPQDTMEELLSRKQPLLSLQQLMRPEFKYGRTYFIPSDQTPVIPADVHSIIPETVTNLAPSPNSWNQDDIMLVLLEDANANPIGLISLDAPADAMRPDQPSLETIEIFASQAAVAIVNHHQFTEMRGRIESLSAGLQRQQRLLSVTQNDLPILLRKDLEQTISVHDLERRAQRIRAGLAITETVSRQLDTPSALLALGREVLTQLGMSIAMIAEDAPDGPRLLHVLGSVPRATNPEALFGQRNPLRTCLQTGEPIIVVNLDENDEWRDSALITSLRAKSLICLPINIGERTVAGMLAISTEPIPSLTSEDRQVYLQIARQASVVLQNISLLNETRRRLQEVNLLLDFSRELSGLNPDHMVNSLLESSRRVLPAAHAGAVLLWDSQLLRLVPRAVSGYADNEGMKTITFTPGESLPGIVYASGKPRRVDEVNFTRDYPLSAEGLMIYRQSTGGRLPVSSLLVPILAGDQNLGVLVLDNFNTPAAFKQDDETLLTSLAQQVALSLENVRLAQATQVRASQLEALTNVATTISSSLQSRELITSLLDQMVNILPYDTATLWLREKEQLTVAAARGFPDTEHRLGLNVKVADSTLFKQMIRTGQTISVADVREDARFPSLEAPRLSWMGIPLVAKGEVIGLIALEKWQASFYTREHIQVGTTFSSQAAVALENARLFEESLGRASELDQRSQRLALLNRFSSALSGLLDLDKILELTAEELLTAMSAQRISLVAFERGQTRLKLVLPRTRRPAPRSVPDAPIFARLRDSQGVFTSENVANEAELRPLLEFLGADTERLMILSMGTSEARFLLLIHADSNTRFGTNEIELARTVGNQASIALENARLYQATLQTAERLTVLNKASSEISSSLDAEEIYAYVHRAAQRLMPVESFVIALLNKEKQEIEGVYLVDGETRSPMQRIALGQGLSGRIIASGEPFILHESAQADSLGGVTYGNQGTPQSILAVPMMLGNETIGMLSAQSYQPNMYTNDDAQILSTLANQAIVAIQNARLFAETQRLAEELEQRVVERTAQLQREQQNTETLLRILTEVSSSLDLDRALNRTLALLNEAISAEQGTIMLLNAEDYMLHYRAGYGYLSSQAITESRNTTLRVGEGLAGWVVENRQAVLIEDLHQDPRWVRNTASSREHRSSIVAPLLVGEDVIGVLMVFHRRVGNFNPEVLTLVRAIANQVAVAINNAHLYELIRDQAERLGTMLRKEQEEASRSQAILEAVADGVLVTSANNNITFLNSSAENILDMKQDVVLGQALDTFGGLFGKAAGAWMQTIQGWSENASAQEAGETYAEQIELDDKRIVLVHLAPVMLQNDFLGTVSIFRDITHEVEVDRLKSEFVATVSHELRTPMTSIRGYADILLLGAAGALNENQSHFLQIIKSNTERLNILVNDLLDISRIEAGRVTLAPQALDLREVAEDVISDVLRRSREENKPMGLSLEAPKELPRVFGDSERVRQILDNLVDNAYHYTPANGQIQVRLLMNDADEIQVDVTDNGVGVAQEDQARVFERFYRGENPLVLATPGTGLGLPIVRQLVEMHHGQIWMQSTGIPGEGSTFSFTLPINQAGPTGRGKNGKNSNR